MRWYLHKELSRCASNCKPGKVSAAELYAIYYEIGMAMSEECVDRCGRAVKCMVVYFPGGQKPSSLASRNGLRGLGLPTCDWLQARKTSLPVPHFARLDTRPLMQVGIGKTCEIGMQGPLTCQYDVFIIEALPNWAWANTAG